MTGGHAADAKGFSSRLVVGLVNNMPDGALLATERQFAAVLRASAGDAEIDLRLFHMAGVERSAFTLSQMRGRYIDLDRLAGETVDVLIVTGAAPRTADLRGEACWPRLAELAHWIAQTGMPSVWSCLAAQVAVLALDGVVRRPLESKRTGVFGWTLTDQDCGLIGLPQTGVTPHSRFNDLAEADLVASGYRIVARSPQAGVEAFTKRCNGPLLLFQGHPEYDADSLLREYRRDLERWSLGVGRAPVVPRNYFPPGLERRLGQITGRGERDSRSVEIADRAMQGFAPTMAWRRGAVAIFGAFLTLVKGEGRRHDHDPPVRPLALQA